MKTKLIYEPSGKALEYENLALNLYRGCPHQCAYCYVPAISRQTREQFFAQEVVLRKPIDEIFRLLEKDCQILTETALLDGDVKQLRVLMSFTTDPYGEQERELGVTRRAIELLNSYGIAVNILTKNGTLARRDLDVMSKFDGNMFGVTVSCGNKLATEWEPRAENPVMRLVALKDAFDMGIRTWVSLEPVIEPNWVLAMIPGLANFVDVFKVGKLNHHPFANTIDWHQFKIDVEKALVATGKEYYIKQDLLRA